MVSAWDRKVEVEWGEVKPSRVEVDRLLGFIPLRARPPHREDATDRFPFEASGLVAVAQLLADGVDHFLHVEAWHLVLSEDEADGGDDVPLGRGDEWV